MALYFHSTTKGKYCIYYSQHVLDNFSSVSINLFNQLSDKNNTHSDNNTNAEYWIWLSQIMLVKIYTYITYFTFDTWVHKISDTLKISAQELLVLVSLTFTKVTLEHDVFTFPLVWLLGTCYNTGWTFSIRLPHLRECSSRTKSALLRNNNDSSAHWPAARWDWQQLWK